MKEKLKSLLQKLFGDSVRAFGVVSLVFLFSLAIAPAKTTSASGATISTAI